MKKRCIMVGLIWIAAAIVTVVVIVNGIWFMEKAMKKTGAKENMKEAVKMPAAPKSSPETTDQFLAMLQDLAKNPAAENEYRKTINRLADVIKNEAGKNPQIMGPFLREVLDLTAKANPGTALLFQDYANEAVKQEMTRLRQESNVIKSTEKEKQIETLKEESRQLKTAAGEKDKKILKMAAELGLTTEKEVQIMLINWFGEGVFSFKVINKTTKKFWFYCLQTNTAAFPSLPPGDYTIEGIYEGKTVATIDKTITQKPVYFYNDELYHCVVIARRTTKILE